jgi:hypothetical protein
VFALALAAFFGCGYLVRRYEEASAERALPDPIVAAVIILERAIWNIWRLCPAAV